MDRGACWTAVHRVTRSWTQLKQFCVHARRQSVDEETEVAAAKETGCK